MVEAMSVVLLKYQMILEFMRRAGSSSGGGVKDGSSDVDHWILDPYCFCDDVPWLTLSSTPAVVLDPSTAGLGDWGVIAGLLAAFLTFLFLLCLLCLLMKPIARCCSGPLCCHKKKNSEMENERIKEAGQLPKIDNTSSRETDISDWMMPRAWLDSSHRDIGLKNGTIGTENTAFDNDELTTTHMGDSRVEGDHVRRQEHDRRQEHHRRQEHNRRQEHHRRQEHDRRQEATANVHMPTYGVHRRTSSKGNADHQVVAATMSRPYEKNREYARVGHQALKIGKQKQEMKARHQPNVCQETKRLCENKQILREDKVNKLLDQSRLVHGERMYAQNHTSDSENNVRKALLTSNSVNNNSREIGRLSTTNKQSHQEEPTCSRNDGNQVNNNEQLPSLQTYTKTTKTTTTTFGDEDGKEETAIVTTTEKKWREGMTETGENCIDASATSLELLPIAISNTNMYDDVCAVHAVKSATTVEGGASDVQRCYEYQHRYHADGKHC